MASITPGTFVNLPPTERVKLAFPPPAAASLAVAVHAGALKAPSSTLTQLVALLGTSIVWAGALDEAMVRATGASGSDPRPSLGKRMLVGVRLWEVFRPGILLATGAPRPLWTVYDGDRPWVVIGELQSGGVLAAPLNDAGGNPKWFTPVFDASDLLFLGAKRSQLELAHLWSFVPPVAPIGAVSPRGQDTVAQAIRDYIR